MKCSSCGTTIEKGETRCPLCGAPAEAGQGWDAPGAQAQQPAGTAESREMTKKEFFRVEATEKVRKGVKSSAILCYVCAVITALAGLLLLKAPLMLIDAVIVLLLGLGIHVKQSRVCAVVVLVYSLISCVTSLISTGQLGGWLLILAGAYAVANTFRLEKEYRAWKSGN